ncbi:MAG: phosphotransferase [Halieaceae bacterium]|jgi:aminoglycoside phosphotransferase (APT) family kinase protein|nr:phosphotransferase [Halieaceae bacterium]
MNDSANSVQKTARDDYEAQNLKGITHWVSKNLGGEVLEVTRLERWRPQWKVSALVDGTTRAVLFRGDRPIAGKNDLKFEMEVMQVLEANGIKVPHIYGWVDSPKAFVMDWIDTQDRAPGMLHTAIESPDTMTEERWQAMLNYMGDLARVHAVPVSEFAHIRRLAHPPQTASQIALHATEYMHKVGKMMGKIDTPLDFLQRWLRRNVPQHRTQTHFLAGDAGQFMSAGTEVLALLDFEIANTGDTHWDLACFRGRHPYENMGDIPALYRRYAEVSGSEVDLPVVCYYTVAFLQLSSIGATFFGTPEARGGNWIEGMLEYASITRRAYEAIAELQGITLDYDLALPEPVIKPWEDTALRKMMIDVERLPTSSDFEPWERDLLHAIPSFLLNYTRYRDWYEKASVKDINQLIGQSCNDLASADESAMRAIAENDPARDEGWVRTMHRRMLRLSMIIAGTDPDDENPLFHKLDPILNQA